MVAPWLDCIMKQLLFEHNGRRLWIKERYHVDQGKMDSEHPGVAVIRAI